MTLLVAYASKHGSTAEIADAIADRLRESGVSVDCAEAGEVGSLERYDAVVLGSAVYMKRWRREARHFLRRHDDALAQLPFWVFSSGPVGEPTEEEATPGWIEPAKVVEQVERLGARDHVVFGGRLPDTHWPGHRAIERSIPAEFRDRRDWDEVRDWADGIARPSASRKRTPDRVRMSPITGETVIARPVGEVFDFVADERIEPRFTPR